MPRPKARKLTHFSKSNPSHFHTSSSKAMISHRKLVRFSKHATPHYYKKKIIKPPSKSGGVVRNFLTITAILVIFLVFGAVGSLAYFVRQVDQSLPDPNKLVDWKLNESTVIMDRHGQELFTIYSGENRRFIPLHQVPEHTKWAILAAEDVSFYKHTGLDVMGMLRAAYIDLTHDQPVQGASTITQQLIKNTLLYSMYKEKAYEKTYMRKIREAIIALKVEQRLSKDEILQMYINEFPCGGVNYGIEACAKAYFGKSAKDLTLGESAMIAGVISSPTMYSPVFGSNPETAKARQEHVLDLMLKHKDVTGATEEQIAAAKAEVLKYSKQKTVIKAPHFVFYIKNELAKIYGMDMVEKGGLRVYTTLDLNVQKILEEEIQNGVPRYGYRYGVRNGAGVILDPKTNQILAMVGSINYNKTNDPRVDGNVNVTTSLRQMGSSVKPYTYAAAFEMGYGPWLEAPDIRTLKFGKYKPENWDGRFYGRMVARQALIQSRNVPAVYVTKKIGVDAFINMAKRVGITTLRNRDQYGLSITLGAAEMKLLEHAQGFSVFATGGVRRDVTGILKITDKSGNILQQYTKNPGKRVLDEKTAYMINWVLCDIGNFGDQPLNQYYDINGRRVLCGKTGTTTGPKDLITIQYHRNLVVAIWTGNNNNRITPGAWATTVPLPIAQRVMKRLVSRYKPASFAEPPGIYHTWVCNETGGLASKTSGCKKVRTIYAAGHPPFATWTMPIKKTVVTPPKQDNPVVPPSPELLFRDKYKRRSKH